MEAMRQSWTDERLDDFRGEVNRRFDEVDGRVDSEWQRIGDSTQVNGRLDSIDDRLAGFQRVLLQAAVAFGVGLLGVLAALIGVIATQL